MIRGKLAVPALVACLMAACQPATPPADKDRARATAAPEASTPAQAPATDGSRLSDVSESTPRYVVGITYPDDINQYPGLAKVVGDYARQAREDLNKALDELGDKKAIAPYELSLAFDEIARTPDLVTVAGNGSSYVGGAHGAPLVVRYTWLPRQDKLLTIQELLPDKKGLVAVSNYVREQLHTQASLNVDGDQDMSPQDRANMLKMSTDMIDDGTKPQADQFSQFEPVLDAAGKLTAIRFVFPPYQVDAYAAGTRTAEVPASVLKPYVAPEYAGLFAG